MIDAKSVMTTDIITVKRKTDIYKAIRLMVENHITGLPVVNDDNTLAGIVSEKDVLRLLYGDSGGSRDVENFMTKDVTAFDQEDSLLEIIECLLKNCFRRVPILNGGKLVGIVSRKDIISYISRQKCKDQAEVRDSLCELLSKGETYV